MPIFPMPRAARNVALLLESAGRHLVEDPALLALQMTRRLPMTARKRAGQVLHGLHRCGARFSGTAALGAFMAGDEDEAEALAVRGVESGSRLAGEVAVLLDRSDVLSGNVSPELRARASLGAGDLEGAIEALESTGRSRSRLARTLRSELRLMTPGTWLPVPFLSGPRSVDGPAREGESMRVLHLITNSLPHTQSGYSLRTHRVLTSLRAAGIESIALTRTGYPVMVGKFRARDEDVVEGIVYRRCLPLRLGGSPEERLTQEVAAALELVRRHRPHVLHATTDYRNGLVAKAVSEATGIPWVLEVRGLMEQTWIASHRTGASRTAASSSQKALLVAAREGELASHAGAVITLSRTMADELESRGVLPEAITLVQNGVDESLLGESLTVHDARDLVDMRVPEGAFVVGAVSALVAYEGHEVLLRAVARMLADGSISGDLRTRLHVVLAGDGVSAPGLASLAADLGIEDRVHLPGRVPREDAGRWVQAMDLIVVPRLDLEVARSVTPQKPVEAMALGRPVVLSDLPALRESVTDSAGRQCAELTEAGDAAGLAATLTALATEPERRERLVARGRALAAERTWPVLMRRYAAVYRQVLAEATEE